MDPAGLRRIVRDRRRLDAGAVGITGNGKWIAGSPDAPLNGKSECAYSGRQDDPGEPPFRGLIAQSWGQIPKFIRDIITAMGGTPGISCNPTKATGVEP